MPRGQHGPLPFVTVMWFAFVVSREVEQGQIAAVRIGEEATLKHCYYQNGVVQLIADNPSVCPPMVYTGSDLDEIEVEGLAVGFCRGLV